MTGDTPDTDIPDTVQALQHELMQLRERLARVSDLEQRLTQTEQVLQAVFHDIPYAVVIMEILDEHSFRPVQANPATLAMLRTRPSQGEQGRAELTERTRSDVMTRLLACLAAGRPMEFEEQLQVAGQIVWTQAIYTPLPRDDGRRMVVITSFDVTARKQQEQEQLQAREALIEQQSHTLAKLSTPLLAISDRVVVLPLIGAVDSRRAQQIMETLLAGIAETGAVMAILDITGVLIVDTQVANALIQAAQAVRLLGAQVILTGVRPEVAQTLVNLGIDLSSILTRSTLQAGITESLRREALALTART